MEIALIAIGIDHQLILLMGALQQEGIVLPVCYFSYSNIIQPS
jgi:hypothetical protein